MRHADQRRPASLLNQVPRATCLPRRLESSVQYSSLSPTAFSPIEAARVARQRDVRIHTVAIGDPTTVGEEKLDTETLRAVAQGTGGSYFFAGDREQLAGIYGELDEIETRQVKVVSHRPRNDLFFWPLLAALLIWMGDKAWVVFHQTRATITPRAPGTVRVDPLTGKLEVQT